MSTSQAVETQRVAPSPSPVASPVVAVSYEIDAAHSRAEFAVRHMMVSTVRGHFSGLAGTVILDDADPSRSRVDATIDARTVNTGVEMRDNHLRSADFFDVAAHPTIAFRSTSVRKEGADTYVVAGELTLRGVARAVELEVESPALEVKDPYGVQKRGAIATLTINRKDFGLNWNQALETGGVLVSDKVRVTIDLQLARK
jgi:polyisoprenoid-binding protein YceI